LDLTRLRSFLEVAERGTVVAASKALGYTAPAVSQHVTKLERELDVLLFERVGGQLTLTPAGLDLLPFAHRIRDLAARATEAVHSSPPRPHLVVAGFASAIATLLTPNLARLKQHAYIEIFEAEDAVALRELRLGHADVAVIQEYPGDDSQRDPRLTYTTGVTDELRLVLPPSYPTSTTVADLATVPWMFNGTGTRCEAATRDILRNYGIDAQVSGNVSDNHVLLQLVSAGHGVTIVPDLVLAESGSAVTVATEILGVTRTMLTVTRTPPTPGARTVVDALTEPSTRSAGR
jgi:DNA-binding transcriptional LysR family regulator